MWSNLYLTKLAATQILRTQGVPAHATKIVLHNFEA